MMTRFRRRQLELAEAKAQGDLHSRSTNRNAEENALAGVGDFRGRASSGNPEDEYEWSDESIGFGGGVQDGRRSPEDGRTLESDVTQGSVSSSEDANDLRQQRRRTQQFAQGMNRRHMFPSMEIPSCPEQRKRRVDVEQRRRSGAVSEVESLRREVRRLKSEL